MSFERYVEEEWDRAEAEYLEQINLATGEPLTSLVQMNVPEERVVQPPTEDGGKLAEGKAL